MGFKWSECECPVCLGVHDELIHAATVRLHAWWRESLMSRIAPQELETEPAAG